MKWVSFLAAIMPDLVRTGRALFKSFKGNVDDAKAALRRIEAHGIRLDQERLEIDKALTELRAGREPKSDA